MAGVFSAKETIFGAFVQEILSMPISLLLALYLVYQRYLFTSSTSKSRGPSNERKNVAATEKQLESMVNRITQERRRWPAQRICSVGVWKHYGLMDIWHWCS